MNDININKNGEDKAIKIILDYLGAVKQAPYLIKEIINHMPKINIVIDINSEKDVIPTNKFKKIFYKDLNKLNPNLRNNINEYNNNNNNNTDLEINITMNKINKNYSKPNPNTFYFHIDPLKFEKRNLLEESSKLELRKKYNITNEKVVVIGSPKKYELPLILDSAKKILQKNLEKEIRFLVVPRNEEEEHAYHCFFIEKKFEMEINKSKLFEEKKGEKKVRMSKMDVHEKGSGIECITETGILENIYSIADVAIIGNTFYKSGSGQNPLEPAFYGSRCISGKYWTHNNEAFKGLKKSKLLKIISGSESNMKRKLQKEIIFNYGENEINEYRYNANKFIKKNQGAAKKYARIIQDYLYPN